MSSPTTKRETAVSTSLCFAMVNWSKGWVSKRVKVIAALAAAPRTAARRRLAPAAVMTRTRPIATMTVLWPDRNGTQSADTPAAVAAAATKASSERRTSGRHRSTRTSASIRTPISEWRRKEGAVVARLDLLATGYAGDRVASTIVLIRDTDATIVVDPGMIADRGALLRRLEQLGTRAARVTDVVFSHHHPDHTLNAALFENARFHDHWAIYKDDVWEDRQADGSHLSESVRLLATPGHTAEDISTLVMTEEGLVACTHLWWSADGPEVDPLALDQAMLERSRGSLLALDPRLIIPGHGAPFTPHRAAHPVA